MTNIIKYSQLSDSKYVDKKRIEMIESLNPDNIFIENDKNATPKEVLDAYTKALSGESKSFYNSDLGKKWQKHFENTDNDTYFKMPSEEYAQGITFFVDEEGKYYFKDDGSNFRMQKYEGYTFETADGKIDDFKQGYTGNCWNLAGDKAISNYENQAEIKKCMKKNPDGSWTVTFRGVEGKPQFTVTKEDFSNMRNRHLSSDDPDIRILEIATKKLFDSGLLKDEKTYAWYDPLNGGREDEMFRYLLDKDEFKTYGFTADSDDFDKHFKQIKPNKLKEIFNIVKKLKFKLPMVAGTKSQKRKSFLDGEFSPELVKKHAYTIDGISDNEIALSNPQNTKEKKVTITEQEFVKSMGGFSIAVPKITPELKRKYSKQISAFNWDKNSSQEGFVSLGDMYRDYRNLKELHKKLEE